MSRDFKGGMAVVAKREIAETDHNVHQGKVQRIREKTGQASAQNTIAHKPAITTMAPPQRAPAERRSNENAGAVAIPTGCSRATLIGSSLCRRRALRL